MVQAPELYRRTKLRYNNPRVKSETRNLGAYVLYLETKNNLGTV
jgi:hypothetical protein